MTVAIEFFSFSFFFLLLISFILLVLLLPDCNIDFRVEQSVSVIALFKYTIKKLMSLTVQVNGPRTSTGFDVFPLSQPKSAQRIQYANNKLLTSDGG